MGLPHNGPAEGLWMGRVMSREVISWIVAVAVAGLFVAIVLWLRTSALAPGCAVLK